ncbi:MAG: hypothetical protein O7C75_20520 [Verrucomicrobia bacterium]|nr:hypothetical protein [Verrucomicrobiota bacterium]
MKDYIIHIGLAKTASSFFQKTVFPRFQGLNYPGIAEVRSFVELNHLQLADDSFYKPEKTKKLIDSFEGDKILISDERLGGRFLGFGGVINRSIIANRLKSLMPNARIMVFLRGQTSCIYSSYHQYIKGFTQGIKPFEEFIYQPQKYIDSDGKDPFYGSTSLGFSPHYVFYFELLKLYTSLFDEVKILLFEDFVHNPEKVLGEMEEFIKPSNSLAGKIVWEDRLNTPLIPSDLHYIRYANSTRYMGNKLLAKCFRKLIHTLNYGFSDALDAELDAVKKLAPIFYSNNKLVTKYFPEAGIQQYPQEYPTGK